MLKTSWPCAELEKYFSVSKYIQFCLLSVPKFKSIQIGHTNNGRPRVVRTNSAIKTVRVRIHENPLKKQKIMSGKMNISSRSMWRLIRDCLDDLYMKTTFGQLSGHLLSTRLKQIMSSELKNMDCRINKIIIIRTQIIWDYWNTINNAGII